jgi:L-asparaginase II
MNLRAPALLAEVWRGEVLEVTVRGHVAVVDESGRLLASAGDPDALTPVRSTVKPLQAQPLVSGGALERLGLDDRAVAVACASHSGEPVHVDAVRRVLAAARLDESALSCGAHWPFDESAARALVAAGAVPGAVHNNCSGKHAGMLAACVVAGWPVAGYAAFDHPLQVHIRALLSRLSGVDVGAAPWGVDGCGLPTHGLPLRALATAFAAAAAGEPGFARCQAAMAAHPVLVGGTGRFDTALLAAAGGSVTGKSGGAACWAGVGRGGGPAVAVKLEAGALGQMPPVALAALVGAGLLPADLPGPLRAHAAPPLTNWAGAVVGETRVRLVLEPAG